jgi:putative acetyltransferase
LGHAQVSIGSIPDVIFDINEMLVRTMRGDEFDQMRATSIAAFDDPEIGTLVDALKESWAWDDRFSFVAVHRDRIVAQVLYTHAILDAPGGLRDVVVLSPIGVLPNLQRSGIGRRLIVESLPILDSAGVPVVFLEGDPAYYGQVGFERAIALGFRKPSLRIPDEAFQCCRLSNFSPELEGTVVYPDAFWRTDSVGLR